MTIKELLCIETYGNVKTTSEYIQNLLITITNEMMSPKKLKPSQFYKKWLMGADSVIKQIDMSLLTEYPVEYRCGYKKKKFFVTSLNGFNITDFIHRRWKLDMDFKQNKLLSYDLQKYTVIAILIMSLTINKYKIETLYREHIIFVCVNVMLTFFTLYKDEKFLVQLNDVYDVTKKILLTDISIFEFIGEKLGFNHQEEPSQRKTRTLAKKDIMDFINPEDSQTTIKKKIMKWCLCGERKARKIMQQYGLTNQNYTRKDYKKKKNQVEK